MNDYQRAKTDINQSFLVSASAGTGKTRVLVERYINILKQTETTVDQIVAITFTEKAAAEMRGRIRRTLRQYPGSANLDISETLDKLNTAPISTIHSFCARVLQENSTVLGLDPQFRIIDEIEESILGRESLELFLHLELSNVDSPILTLIRHFDLQQIRNMLNSVWLHQADLSRQLRSTAEYLPESLYESLKQFHFNSTLKPLKECFSGPAARQAIDTLRCNDARDSRDTLQQVKVAALAVIVDIESDRIPAAVTESRMTAAFALNKRGKKENWDDNLDAVRDAVRVLRSCWDRISDRIFPFELDLERLNAELLIPFAKLALKWLNYHRAILNEQAAVDFNGLELLTEAFFQSGTSAARNYARRFQHLLVDEFQDISPIQDRIFNAILALNPQLITFYVGDEKQSIYRFRGAEVEIFNTHKKSKPPLYLDSNFRSLKALNDFFNRFFTFLFNQQGESPEYAVRYEKPVKSDDTTLSPEIPVDLLIMNSEDNGNVLDLSVVEAEFANVVQRLKQLHGHRIVRNGNNELRPAEWRDFAILLRSRTHQEQLEQMLRRVGIPYYVSSGVGFYRRREVMDVLNFLRALLNWYDETALIGTLRSPMVGMSDTGLMALTTENGLMDGIQKIINNDTNFIRTIEPKYIEQFQTFYRMYLEIRQQLPVLNTAELIQLILDKTHYLAVLAAFPEEKQSYANVRKLIDLALEWSSGQEISLVDYIRRVQLYQMMQVREGEANLSSDIEDSVKIMTIHAAKGLAFPIVVIPELASPHRITVNSVLADANSVAINLKTTFNTRKSYRFQHLAQIEKERSLAEEKRISYVAATRAESYLVFSAVQKSGQPSTSTWNAMADFFADERCQVQRHEYTMSEIVNIISEFKADSSKTIKTLTDKQRQSICTQLAPLPVSRKVKKVTATAFAAWISQQAGELSNHKKYTSGKPVLDLSGLPTALELGVLIHRAFSWWDFKDVEELVNFTSQLLKPYTLDASEFRELVTMFGKWGKRFINQENKLVRYIRDAETISREVDVYAWIENTLIEGKIDLLLKMKNNDCLIIDFKSDHIQGHPDAAVLKKHSAQLHLYALMLSQHSKLKVNKTGLYFIRNGMLIEQEISAAVIETTRTQLSKYINQ